ncbi:MAG: hypothetical protein KJ687_10225 [Proteobacteria bacterium]|nr:hypothetical protein [Pseudomonadota bacterium]
MIKLIIIFLDDARVTVDDDVRKKAACLPVKKNLKLSGRRINTKALAEKVSERYNVSTDKLRSWGRRRAVVKARHTML